MAARPLSYNGPPGPGQPRQGMMYPSQPQPQPVYHQPRPHPQQPPYMQPQPHHGHHPRPVYSTPQQQPSRPFIHQRPPPLHQQQHPPHPQHQQHLHQLHQAQFQSPRPHFAPALHNVHSPPHINSRPHMAPAPSLSMPMPMPMGIQPQKLPQQPIPRPAPPPPYSTAPAVSTPPGSQAFVLRTPSLGAAPSLMGQGPPPPSFRPGMPRPPIMTSAGPPTIVSSPGLARMPTTMAAMRPVLIAAGPPSIIKNPNRTKALLERPVPHIEIKQKINTLLSNFWGEDLDVAKDGRILDRSHPRSESPSASEKARLQRQTGITVGIDFGNTFTGVSYAHQTDCEMIDVVKWPRHLNAYAKVPTVSLYKTKEDQAFVDWGSSALASFKRTPADRIILRDYKLLFFDQGEYHERLSNGLRPMEVFTQYIKSVHQHLMEEVTKSQVLAAEEVPFHYCITVPQSWTHSTREQMLQSYVEAGIIPHSTAPNMTMMTEAEAAATYCKEKCEEFELLKDGDIFMICDAGGRMTDVTVFRVDDGLGVRQFVRMSSSHAENCGSVMVDRNFRELVERKLRGLDINATPKRRKAFETLLEGFKEIKSQFDGNSMDEVKHLSVPMGLGVKELQPPPAWLEDEYMALTGQELCQQVFDPVIETVQELVNVQSKIHPLCAGLFLVGGLGANKYLHFKLEMQRNPGDEVQDAAALAKATKRSSIMSLRDLKLNGEMQNGEVGIIKRVVMVPKAEMAVARGAVLYGLKCAARLDRVSLPSPPPTPAR